MNTIRIAAIVVAATLVSSTLMANGPGKYKDWDSSPQGYFLTKGEREAWSAVRSEDEAQRFVEKFLAGRGPGFAAEVASRVEQADKHLSIGKAPGSKSLRGRLIVMFGPPSALEVSEVADTSEIHRDGPGMMDVLAGGTSAGAGGGKSGGTSIGDKLGNTSGAGRTLRLYHFTFNATPAGKVDVTVAADTATGKDRIRSRDEAKALEAALEAAAAASIKTK